MNNTFVIAKDDPEEEEIHVLVAQDDNFQRLALIDLLSLANLKTTDVENGRLARDELLRQDVSYDLVLLDVNMPEMDGLELLEFINQEQRLKNIPVIMMSADNESELISTCL